MARPAYRLVAHSLWDIVPILMALAHFSFVLWLVLAFHSLSWWVILPAALLYAVSLSWSINSISHNQIHNAYFSLPWLNRAFDLLLSVTIGFPRPCTAISITAITVATRIGPGGRHHGRPAVDLPAWPQWPARQCLGLHLPEFFRDDPKAIYQEMQRKRPADARWVKVEIGVTVLAYVALALYDWHALLVLLPFWYLGQSLSSLNGYYEHLGGNPDLPIAWGVSSYSRLYNLIWMNNGYHAEHHYRPKMHWTRVKAFHREIREQQRAAGVKVIPLAHGLGFLLKHPKP